MFWPLFPVFVGLTILPPPLTELRPFEIWPLVDPWLEVDVTLFPVGLPLVEPWFEVDVTLFPVGLPLDPPVLGMKNWLPPVEEISLLSKGINLLPVS